MELYDLVSFNRDALPNFLLERGRGGVLKRMIRRVEREDAFRGYPRRVFKKYCELVMDVPLCLDYLRRNCKSVEEVSFVGRSYEIPTVELCCVMRDLVAFAKSKKLREVGAGTALLTRMLGYYLAIPIRATDKFTPDTNDQTYAKVDCESFEETRLEMGEDVIISWLHPTLENAFLEMVERNLPTNVWHVGQLAPQLEEDPIYPGDVQCFSREFVERMRTLGYGYQPVTARQCSHVDYFLSEEEIAGDTSRTSVAWFSRAAFPDITAICNPGDFAVYRTISTEGLQTHLTENYPKLSQEERDEIIWSAGSPF